MSKLVGEIFMFGVQPPPTGAIEAGGQAISRITYADLYRVYGTTYGVGNGTTTFNVPDLRGRVVAGPTTMAGNEEARLTIAGSGISGGVGSTGGAETHTLVATEVPPLDLSGTEDWSDPAADKVCLGNGTTNSPVSCVNGNGGAAHRNVQPTIIIPFCIWTGVMS